MKTDTSCCGQFGRKYAIVHFDGIISRLQLFRFDVKRLIFVLLKIRLADRRHKQNVAIIGNSRAAQMRVRKTVNRRIGIMITRTSVPIINARVGRELHHSERHRRARKCVSVSACADERIDIARVIFCLSREIYREN